MESVSLHHGNSRSYNFALIKKVLENIARRVWRYQRGNQDVKENPHLKTIT